VALREHSCLSSFFDPPPPPRTPRAPDAFGQPPWFAPPVNVLGELVADRTVIWRSESMLFSLDHLRAYPEGFEFRIGVRSRSSLHGAETGRVVARGARFPGPEVRVIEHPLRLGLEFADGVRLTNLAPVVGVGLDGSPPAPLLVRRGGGGIGGRWDEHFWVWGLPPDGPISVVLESPAHDVPTTAVTLEGGAVRTAAEECELLWEQPRGADPALWPFQPPAVYAPEPRADDPGPADAERAREAVVGAFTAMHEVVDGELVNVEEGRALEPSRRDLDSRFPTAQTASYTVERVGFISATEAAVWFSVWLGQHPFLSGHRGSAVLDEGRWKVSRSTFCGLLARVGIRCPEVRRPGS
jgi:hypothetical protein